MSELNCYAFYNEARNSDFYLKVREAGAKDIVIDTERL
jgi:hypothetical protein